MTTDVTTEKNLARTWADVPEIAARHRRAIPEGLWIQCPSCAASLFRRATENNLWVCPECDHHFRLSAAQRVRQLVDPGSFEEIDEAITPADPLTFTDLKPYQQRLEAARRATGRRDAIISGVGFVKGRRAVLAVMDFTFLGGSMGSVVGEKITRAVELAEAKNLPLIIVSASGGARMMESGYSLMQMAKTAAALARFDDAGGLYISVLTDPTTGGVTASFAMLGDVILAEKNALIGFAGPRVIAQTIRQALPAGFQRAEFLRDTGFVDRVVHRRDLRSEIGSIIDYAGR
ncbi:MAG: acetyl-CoA carboxylase, carboxyltransferase subunit beta [Phycisphaeraceae bacterium]|nr:acetyl-CoA carboxylase, carboxyltransferase subunit beta [Phycisphaeraceae bacterium]